MPRRQFWEIVKDDAAKTIEVLGKSYDDTPLINITCEMQDAGMEVRSETAGAATIIWSEQIAVRTSKEAGMQTSSNIPSEKVVLTPTEFASLFGRHYTWAYRQIYAGKIKVLSNLGRIMIPRSEVDRLLQQTETYSGKK